MATFKDKQILAHLVKHNKANNPVPVWYWINPMTGVKISPEFRLKDDADKWFDDLVSVHNDTYDLLNRTKQGKIFNLRAVVDVTGVISSTNTKKCPFKHEIKGDVLYIDVLGADLADARTRVEEFFDVGEWLE